MNRIRAPILLWKNDPCNSRLLISVLNDKFVADLSGLVPAHLQRSQSIRCVHAWCVVAVL